MSDSPHRPESSPSGDDRQRRLDALRRLAQSDPVPAPTPQARSTKSLVTGLDGSAHTPSRRRWLPLVLLGALLVALAAGVFAWLGPGLRHAPAGTATHPLAPFVINLPTQVYCPSQVAWSPDGKYVAVVVKTIQPGGDGWCYPYADLVSSSAAQGLQANGYQGSFSWDATVLVFDASTGAMLNRLTPVDPTGQLCAGAPDCAGGGLAPISLAWSPDGSSVLLFTMLQTQLNLANGQTLGQTRGALEIMRADGKGSPRLLIAFGRKTIVSNGLSAATAYSTPLFTFDLSANSGTYSDIHEQAGIETAVYAPGYQVGPKAQVTSMNAPASSALSPRSYGVLFYQGIYATGLPSVAFQSSQWAWSTDGRYVSPDVDTTAFIDVDKVTSSPSENFPGAYTPPFVAPPDAATFAVVRAMAPLKLTTYVARDPRGSRLASFACDPSGDTGKLMIRATMSGKTLAETTYKFPTRSTSFGCPGDAEAINWSPDGTQVAMADNQDDQIVIWRIPAHA
jgi:hypothetical protein